MSRFTSVVDRNSNLPSYAYIDATSVTTKDFNQFDVNGTYQANAPNSYFNGNIVSTSTVNAAVVSGTTSISAPQISATTSISTPQISATTSISAPTITATTQISTPLLMINGQTFQMNGVNAIAIGKDAGQLGQGQEAIAIGFESGNTNQGIYTIAIGKESGKTSQGQYAVGIGYRAGVSNQHERTIILNASNHTVVTAGVERCYIAPIRNVTTAGTGQNRHVYYSTGTHECTTSANVKQFEPNAAWPSNSGCIGEMIYAGPVTTNILQSNELVYYISGAQITLGQGLWQIQAWHDLSGGTSPTKFRGAIANVSGSGFSSNISGAWSQTLVFNTSGSTSNILTTPPMMYYVGTTPITFIAAMNVVSPAATYSWTSYIQAIRFA
jgi:hypothetical protein